MVPLVLATLASVPVPVRFVALGDTPYRDADIPRLDALLASFSGKDLAFAAHVGDVKRGSSPCDDPTLAARRDQLARSPIPLVYTPGDNEWTDCHRAPIDGRPVDPLERLAKLRSLFYAAPLGQGHLEVASQSRFEASAYPENQRWVVGGVVFATFHVVGSDDGRGRNDAGDAEALARRRADLAWLVGAAELARATDAPALVLFQQADLEFSPARFADWRDAIARVATASGRPVLLVHGDSHDPLIEPGYLGVPTLWRVIVPGDEALGASLITVNPSLETPFSVAPFPISP